MVYVVLIEDDADLRREIKEFLVRRQHTVSDSGRLADARRIIAEQSPDAVISDINLPDGDGAVFCAEQALRLPRTRWLVISGDPKAVDRSRQFARFEDGRFTVVGKPVSLRRLDDFLRGPEKVVSFPRAASS